ncbi:calcium/proton antiporter, CaCA family [Allomeiothermus silvanus DSM 9946]|uniref:Ca(2+)/H(+) antiporter n=1 Tax=Allomeiothermus silvanus (strain ATCC 700542 / DSM 9946 / NBRC 106475 / NCIMB 13440 / VI-R2) TaxID=526227 RepID=D7BC20_ALLS1|nr:calcium/proton exchanger [Allomeiothermus silvanus]ADH62816.1 calcium/proton antiporter, CaCA family [Allomeiothermus silvanus DSM 9946]
MLNYILLVFVPIALVLELLHAPGVWIFIVSALALLPLASWMGRATEELAARTGSTVGGLLNATFGNAAELIIAGVALAAGKLEVVKASITGSILSNLLLVLGLSIFLGGLRFNTQRFNANSANIMATLLVLSMVAFLLPAFFDLAERTYFRVDPTLPDLDFSHAAAIVLVLVYLANIWFSLRTHRDLVSGRDETHLEDHPATWSVPVSIGVLAAATVGVAVMAEFLVGSLEAATSVLGLSEFFVGIILIPLVGNAAEHFAAIGFAIKNKMDLAVQIAIGSALQIALLVAPLLILLGWIIGRPMNLVFQNPLELAALAASIIATNAVVRDGETNWLEGFLLLGVYVLLGFAFFFTPR